MAKTISALVVGFAIFVALAIGLYLSVGPAEAQPVPGVGPVGRFQISAYGWANAAGGAQRSESGAYIVDMQTGEVFHATGRGEPVSIGLVGKKK
jgi:hypothetical protein